MLPDAEALNNCETLLDHYAITSKVSPTVNENAEIENDGIVHLVVEPVIDTNSDWRRSGRRRKVNIFETEQHSENVLNHNDNKNTTLNHLIPLFPVSVHPNLRTTNQPEK